MATRRFNVLPETILRDLRLTVIKMGATETRVLLGGKLSKELTRQYARAGIAVAELQLDLAPVGAAVQFTRDGAPYRFPCTKWAQQIDNLRAAQRAVSGLYTIFEEYGVSQERGERAAFDRLFAGHRLALGDGTTGDAWHEVLHVAPTAGIAVIAASYRALAKQLHPDRNAGDSAQMVRLNRAYAEAQAALAL
ncbi:MAG TPA: DnaJ domain-containing protein [Thermomicrobiales bacterium]|jgi:hypothetical protein